MGLSEHSDRRGEQRFFHRSGQPLSWRPHIGGRRHRAWLRNISLSGISFVSQGSRHPAVGQEVDITYEGMRALGDYRVVRVENVGKQTAVIGCARDAGVPSPLMKSGPEPVECNASVAGESRFTFERRKRTEAGEESCACGSSESEQAA
ncbi:MAG: PilZ domain-containing protein [Phycisphaeraceae bacterium]